MSFTHPNTDATTSNTNTQRGNDEISEYQRSKYLSACEASWRLFGFELHVRNPSVEQLPVHLPSMNNVTFTDESILEDVLHELDIQKSMLTKWFVANHFSRISLLVKCIRNIGR